MPDGAAAPQARSVAAGRLRKLFEEWFRLECDRAYRLFQDPDFASATMPSDAERSALLQHTRSVTSLEAALRLEQLHADYLAGDLVAGRAIVRRLIDEAGLPGHVSLQAMDRAAVWVMHGLAAIEEARALWASGDIQYRPAMPVLSLAAEAPAVVVGEIAD